MSQNVSSGLKIWLDLEETIINNWYDGLLIRPGKIKHWLKSTYNVDEINIWSFAIWDENDKKEFVSSGMKEAIEKALECRIIDFPSVEEMQYKIEEYEGIKYDSRGEFMQLNQKRWSFMKYCLGYEPNTRCVLLDDAVPSWELIDWKTKTVVHLINVTDI